jgi:hypothetical protein
MRDRTRMLALALAAAACSGGSDGGTGSVGSCGEPGTTCNDGLCFNGAASGVCDQNGNCRTEPAASGNCVVFVTSSTQTGNLGGLAGADSVCQRSAEAAGLKGTFKAWLSDSGHSAAQRLTHSSVAYVDTQGHVIASHWADLTDGSLSRAMTIDEKGYDWDAQAAHCGITRWLAEVWTATTVAGDAEGPFCADWTDSGEALAATGLYCYASAEWTDPAPVTTRSACSAKLSLYCLQQ